MWHSTQSTQSNERASNEKREDTAPLFGNPIGSWWMGQSLVTCPQGVMSFEVVMANAVSTQQMLAAQRKTRKHSQWEEGTSAQEDANLQFKVEMHPDSQGMMKRGNGKRKDTGTI
ncbi:hypothetical protein PISMIDRAFT_24879 [Pisolithus microcarpus 441]|uniref:Uncharacterized protein n=1 Tax=Pisolithus microcarpus 441 TaxID=765257 RepID=A0A0C9YU33_9AGAM|nr:hypothetical protein PISMIDRAFT_24879 [Pisolithus microcarpus 441]